LRLRKNDFERVHSLEQRKEMQSHREKLDKIYRQRLEEEKRRLIKGKLQEFEDILKENRELKEELARIRIAMTKGASKGGAPE
jgi:hypothetical protein